MNFLKFAINAIGFFPLFLIFNSCSKDPELVKNDPTKPIWLMTQSDTIDYTNFSDELDSIWAIALDVYGMEVLCSCGCERTEAIKGIFDNYSHLSVHLDSAYWKNKSCEEMMLRFSNDCNYDNTDEYIDFVLATLDSNSVFLSYEEKELIEDLINDARDGDFDIYQYRQNWYDLNTQSSINNIYSLVVIETSISVKEFVAGNPHFDGNEPQAIFNHIAGAIAGAGVNLYLDAVWGAATGEGVDDVWGSLAKGAIGGALTSL